jgi:hypothetical protein
LGFASIINGMKYWRVLLLCLAVLLPWRSTLAVTMVMAPMTQHSMPAQLESAPCPHHASSGDAINSHEAMSDHASCDVCHVQALGADLRTTSPAHAHPIGPAPLSERFASAWVTPHHKPPISV